MTESYHDDYDGEPKPCGRSDFCDEHQKFRSFCCAVCLDRYVDEQVSKRTEILNDTLTRCQEECTRLLNENRALRTNNNLVT
jgi:hypothetical protein